MMTENDNPICKRCGICCHHYNINGKLTRCKHLVRLKGGKTLCRIYNTRTGTVVGKAIKDGKIVNVFCAKRQSVPFNYPGCPFNKPGQKMAFVDEKVPMMDYKKGMFD